MKKNLLSLIILSLLIVNIALTAIMAFSVMKTNDATSKIVTDIASIVNVELDKKNNAESDGSVSLKDTDVYTIEDQFQVSLLPDEGETKTKYCIVKVSISMNKKHPDYSKNKNLADNEALISSEITSVIGSYTYSEAQVSREQMLDEILQRIQELYGSDFIYKVSFSSFMFG